MTFLEEEDCNHKNNSKAGERKAMPESWNGANANVKQHPAIKEINRVCIQLVIEAKNEGIERKFLQIRGE